MQKTILDPVEGSTFAEAVNVSLPEYDRVFISGAVAYGDDGTVIGTGDAGKQTRAILEQIQALLARVDGTMDDIVRVRVYVTDLNDEDFERIHAVRDEFFTAEHYPASTLVEVGALVDPDLLVEIDAEAIIPSDSWESTVDT